MKLCHLDGLEWDETVPFSFLIIKYNIYTLYQPVFMNVSYLEQCACMYLCILSIIQGLLVLLNFFHLKVKCIHTKSFRQ